MRAPGGAWGCRDTQDAGIPGMGYPMDTFLYFLDFEPSINERPIPAKLWFFRSIYGNETNFVSFIGNVVHCYFKIE